MAGIKWGDEEFDQIKKILPNVYTLGEAIAKLNVQFGNDRTRESIMQKFKTAGLGSPTTYLKKCTESDEDYISNKIGLIEIPKDFWTEIVMADGHSPYQDDRIVNITADIIKEVKPDGITYNGDGHDFYQMSYFNKHPARVLETQQDLDIFARVTDKYWNAAPSADKRYEPGNHDGWPLKYKYDHPALISLRSMSLDKMLRLSERGVKLQKYKTINLGGLLPRSISKKNIEALLDW